MARECEYQIGDIVYFCISEDEPHQLVPIRITEDEIKKFLFGKILLRPIPLSEYTILLNKFSSNIIRWEKDLLHGYSFQFFGTDDQWHGNFVITSIHQLQHFLRIYGHSRIADTLRVI